MKDKQLILIVILSVGFFLMAVVLLNLQFKINDLEEKQLEINEYIFNKIETPKGAYEKIQSNK